VNWKTKKVREEKPLWSNPKYWTHPKRGKGRARELKITASSVFRWSGKGKFEASFLNRR